MHLLLRQIYLTEARVLVRRELYLLEYRRRLGHEHLAPAVISLRFEIVSDVDAQRRVAVGVVFGVDFADEALHLLRVEAFDDVGVPAVEVYRVGEYQSRRGAAVHRAYDLRLLRNRDVGYRVVLARRAAQRKARGGVGVVLPVVAPAVCLGDLVQHAVLREVVEYLVDILSAELFARREGQLEGRALDVAHLYVGVVRVDARLLRGRAVEPFGARGEELVERVGRGDEHRRRKAAAPPSAPYLLPRRGDAARVAVQHGEA